MKFNESSLHIFYPYNGLDQVMLGNEDFFNITHIVDATLGFGSSKIPLRDVLLVLELERSLRYIGQLTSDNPVNCEFSNRDFVIKDRMTHQLLLKGTKQSNPYTICASPVALFSTKFYTASKET